MNQLTKYKEGHQNQKRFFEKINKIGNLWQNQENIRNKKKLKLQMQKILTIRRECQEQHCGKKSENR